MFLVIYNPDQDGLTDGWIYQIVLSELVVSGEKN